MTKETSVTTIAYGVGITALGALDNTDNNNIHDKLCKRVYKLTIIAEYLDQVATPACGCREQFRIKFLTTYSVHMYDTCIETAHMYCAY